MTEKYSFVYILHFRDVLWCWKFFSVCLRSSCVKMKMRMPNLYYGRIVQNFNFIFIEKMNHRFKKNHKNCFDIKNTWSRIIVNNNFVKLIFIIFIISFLCASAGHLEVSQVSNCFQFHLLVSKIFAQHDKKIHWRHAWNVFRCWSIVFNLKRIGGDVSCTQAIELCVFRHLKMVLRLEKN